jgi:hypothetical protein
MEKGDSFTPRVMEKVRKLMKKLESSVKIKDKHTWVRAKSQLWVIVDDLCEKWESINARTYALQSEVAALGKIKNKMVQQVYVDWYPMILEYIEENYHKVPITPSTISEYFNWDVVIVRAVINQMLEDNLLQVCKKWLR